MNKRPLRIGLSSSMMHPDPTRPIYKGKRLLFVEESMTHWVMSQGALAFLLPTRPISGVSIEDMVATLDGVVLTGGVDVAPESYGETPLQPEWCGDRFRDEYEIAIVKAALKLDKPLLGVCRGHQLLNVAMGGTLFQDINTQNPAALLHRNWDVYDANFHEVRFNRGSQLQRLFNGLDTGRINSVHHQAVKDVAPDLLVEAHSPDDGIVESVRLRDAGAAGCYLVGVQWHPEFHDPKDSLLLGSSPILTDFMQAVRKRQR